MKTKYCLLVLFTIAFISNNLAQTIRLVGTLNGPKKYFSLQSDGTNFGILSTLPISSVLESGLLEASDKLIYGASTLGGANGDGFLFRMYADGRNYETLHVFDQNIDSRAPNGDLIEGSDGKIYGTALSDGQGNGDSQSGTIFRLEKDGSNFEVLHYFDASNGDGSQLHAGLIEASDGLLYGTTEFNGAFSNGTLFSMSKDGSGFTVVGNFSAFGGTSGQLVENNGKLFGISGFGGGFGGGAIYSYDLTSGTLTGVGGIPASLGSSPDKNIILSNGFIYGFTNSGGTNNTGSIFKFEIATGTYTSLYSFTTAQSASKTLIIASNGKLYGTIQNGGTGVGSFFELTTTGTFTEFYAAVAPNGQPKAALIEIINTPPTLIAPASDVNLLEGVSTYTLDLSTTFTASDEPLQNLEARISNLSNPGLFSATSIVSGILSLEVADDVFGSSDVTLRAVDSRGDFTETTFNFTVDPVADDPAITAASTTYQSFNTSGLVISKNVVDGAEVTHFKVTNIVDGELFLNNEITTINEGDFITFTEGALGLKFFSTAAGEGSFDIQASTVSADIGLGGSVISTSITSGKATLSVLADNASRIYGAANPTIPILYAGFLDGDDSSDLDTPPVASSLATSTSDVGAYAIQAGGGADDNYQFSYVAGSLTITKADLQVIADDLSFTYGALTLPTLSLSYLGFANSETASVLNTLPSGLTTNAVTTSAAGNSFSIIVNQDGADNNYNLIYVDGTMTVDKAPLIVQPNDKVITYGESLPTFDGTLISVVNGDDITASYTSEADGMTAGTFNITATLNDPNNQLSNYDVTLAQGTLTINATPLTVVANDQMVTYGESLPTFDGRLTGVVNSDDITASYTSETDGMTAGIFDITAKLNDPDNRIGNYVLTNTPGTLTIEKADLSVKANDQTITFGDALPIFDGKLTGVVNSDNITASYTSTALATSDVGTYPVTAVLNDPSSRLTNYEVTNAAGIVTIDQADQTITFGSIADVDIINGNTVTLGATTSSGLDIVYSVDVGDGTIDNSGILTINKTGDFTITASQAGDNNYNAATAVSQSFVVIDSRKTDQTITFTDDLSGLTYGDGTVVLTGNSTSQLDISYTTSGPISISDETITINGAGAASITASQSGNSDINSATSVTIDFNIAKATLTATADDKTIAFGSDIPTFRVLYSGFIGDDTTGSLDVLPTTSTIATNTSSIGTYPIELMGGDDDDYDYSYVFGILTIEKASQAITFDAIADVDISTTTNVTLAATSSAGLDITYVLEEGDGSIFNNILTVNSTGNFTVSASQSGNGNVEAATTITQSFQAIDAGKIDQEITFLAIQDAAYGDVLSLSASANSSLQVSYELVSGLGSIDNSELTITGIGSFEIRATQSGDATYNPAPSITLQFTVSKANLIARPVDIEIIEGVDLPTLEITYSGLKLGETVDVLDELPIASVNESSIQGPGEYPILISRGSDDHYEFELQEGLLTVLNVLSTPENPNVEIKVFPNPTRNKFSVNWNGEGPVAISVLDQRGGIQWATELVQGLDEVDASEWPKGLYHIRLFKRGQLIGSHKLLVQ